MGYQKSSKPGVPLYSTPQIKPLNVYNQVSTFEPDEHSTEYVVSSNFRPGSYSGKYTGSMEFDRTQTQSQYGTSIDFNGTSTNTSYVGSSGFMSNGTSNTYIGSVGFDKTKTDTSFSTSTNFSPTGPSGIYTGSTTLNKTKSDIEKKLDRGNNSIRTTENMTKYAESTYSSSLLNGENYGYTKMYGLEEYLTGADVFVFINDIVGEEIVSISYVQQENIIPIHGYASYTWDSVAYGTRLIQGTIVVNYVYDHYLIDMINKANPPTKAMVDKISYPYLSLEELKEVQFYDYKAYANAKAKEIWGEDKELTVINNYRKPYYDHDYLDITISYGNEGIPLGECAPTGIANVEIVKSQVSVLNNVRITGVQKSYSPSGDVLMETYTFIAQDMNNTMGQRK